MSNTSSNSDQSLTLTIRLSSSARFTIGDRSPITPSSTILQLKDLISQREESGHCPVHRQRLIHKGRILSDNGKTLSDYGIGSPSASREGIVLYLVKGSETPTGAAVTSAATAPASAEVPSASVVNNNPTLGYNSNTIHPFANMSQMMSQMGSSGLGAGGMPDMAQFQQQLQSNPQMMQEMLNNPMVQNLLNQPDFIRSMMENNPQMRQVLDSNPELRHALQDPELMRRSMQMMRDPTAMQNMMRNQDLAMSQIENMPGGYNALRRMYEDVQAPMMDAMASGSETGTSTNSGTGTGQGGTGTGNSRAQNQPMPNPWGSSSVSTTNPATAASSTAAGGVGANPFASPFGMPNMGATSSGISNPWANPAMMENPGAQLEATIQMLENPMMNQMMQQVMSNPEAMRQMIEANPMMRQLRDSDPQAAAIFSNPEMMRAMMNPQTLRSMMQLQQAFSGITPPISTGTLVSTPSPPGGLDFSSLLGNTGTGTVPNPFLPLAPGTYPTSRTHPAPGDRFRHQLQSLNDMGFTDRSANIRALTTGHGNINRAIEILLENPTESPVQSETRVESALSDGHQTGDRESAESNDAAAIDRTDGSTEPKGTTEKKND